MGNGVGWNEMPTDMRARWVAALMAQSDGGAAAGGAATAPQMAGDSVQASAAQGSAAAAVAVPGGGQQLVPPPEIRADDSHQIDTQWGKASLVTTADGRPYLNGQVYGLAVRQQDGTEATIFTNAQGQPIDLAALEAQYGIGVPGSAPAPQGAAPTAGTQGTAPVPAEDPNAPQLDTARTDRSGRPQIKTATGQPWANRELYYDQDRDKIFDANGTEVRHQDVGLPAPDPNLPVSDPARKDRAGRPQLVTRDGQPFAGRELYYDRAQDKIFDAQGNEVNPQSLAQPSQPSDPNEPYLDFSKTDSQGRPQLMQNGKPFQDREIYADPRTNKLYDKNGNEVNPADLAPGWVKAMNSTFKYGMPALITYWNVGYARHMYRTSMQYNLPLAQRRLSNLQATVKAGQAEGASALARWRARKAEGQIESAKGAVKSALTVSGGKGAPKLRFTGTAAQMASARMNLAITQERIRATTQASTAFRRSMAEGGFWNGVKRYTGVQSVQKLYDTHVRQPSVIRMRADAKAIQAGQAPTLRTRVGNALHGRGMGIMMTGFSAYNAYNNISDAYKRRNDPTNVRKWDDYARVTGSVLETAGSAAMLRRGDIRAGVGLYVAGTLTSLVGSIAGD